MIKDLYDTLLNKFVTFAVKRKLEKSGQLEDLELMFKARAVARYSDFEDLWNDISLPMNDRPDEQKKLFFDFQFMLLSSTLENLTREEVEKIKLIAMEFYGLPMSGVKTRIASLRKQLPEFPLRDEKLILIPNYTELLSQTHLEFEDANDYTFDEAISVMPEDLGYPEDFALKILAIMGYTRENVTSPYPPTN